MPHASKNSTEEALPGMDPADMKEFEALLSDDPAFAASAPAAASGPVQEDDSCHMIGPAFTGLS